MFDFTTIGNRLKRGMVLFSERVAKDFSKPTRKFIADMVYGIVASSSCKLTDIGRALKEDASLKKIVERLGRHLIDFREREALMNGYLASVQTSIGKDPMLLIDGSDVTKPCSPKMEGIGSVYDASEKKFGEGYWTMGAVALTSGNGHPIPVYEKLYPCKKQGGKGFNKETEEVLQYLRTHFDKSVPRIADRGFDSWKIMRGLVSHEEKFIIRQNQNRVVLHDGKRTMVEDVARRVDCKMRMRFHSKTGNSSECKIGMTQITLCRPSKLTLRLVVCKEFGEKPLVLYTNLDETEHDIAVRIVKAYLMRWRIEEYHAFKKQGLNFEDFRVRSLNAIQNVDLLLTIAVGYLGTLCAKASDDILVLEIIAISKRIENTASFLKKAKFLYYAVLAGISCILAGLRCGISRYFAPLPPSLQIRFPGV